MTKEIRNLGFIALIVLAIGFGFYAYINSNEKIETPKTALTNLAPIIGNMSANHSFYYGPADAKVTVVEFFDPECESCAAVAPLVKKQMQNYEGKVKWVFRYMAYHKNSNTAIRVLEAARKQNLFLEVQHILFETQRVWGEQQSSTEKEILEIVAQVKSINMGQLKKDMKDSKIDEIINKDKVDGTQGGVTGTPTFFVNGVILEQLSLDLLSKRIDEGL